VGQPSLGTGQISANLELLNLGVPAAILGQSPISDLSQKTACPQKPRRARGCSRVTAPARCRRRNKAGRLTYVGQPSRLASRTPQQTTGAADSEPGGLCVPAELLKVGWRLIAGIGLFGHVDKIGIGESRATLFFSNRASRGRPSFSVFAWGLGNGPAVRNRERGAPPLVSS
jgi:hypothetical protein